MTNLDPETAVICSLEEPVYPGTSPFHPSKAYPEYGFGELAAEKNLVYDAVRRAFSLAGLDAGRRGTPAWNPLGSLVHPGETVLLKPNMVKERHPRDPDGWRYVLTHGSVIRAVADFVFAALHGSGRVVLADAPQTDSSFAEMVRLLGLDAIRDFYCRRGLRFDLVDLRREEWVNRGGVVVSRRRLPGDPEGTIAFDLGAVSELAGHGGAGRYYGADYDTKVLNEHHIDGHHEYLFSATAINADVIFSLPKLKTHKKAGITVSLKNLVGLNADKNWLPHHTKGSPDDGGDEHPVAARRHRLERALATGFQQLSLRYPIGSAAFHQRARKLGLRMFGTSDKVVRSGNWWGNDTIWRTCLDLNTIALYGDADGRLRPPGAENRKRHFVLVDGVIAGEGMGPTDPDPVPAGVLVFGVHPATVDAACAWLIGFDPDRIPIVRHAFDARQYPIADWRWDAVVLVSDRAEWSGPMCSVPSSETLHFRPHFGWDGHIERRRPPGHRAEVKASLSSPFRD